MQKIVYFHAQGQFTYTIVVFIYLFFKIEMFFFFADIKSAASRSREGL